MDDPARDQYEALSACDGEYICPGAYGVADGIGGPGIDGGECIAGALRDRTAGFYGVLLDESGGAWLVTQYVLMADGTGMLTATSRQACPLPMQGRIPNLTGLAR